MKTFLRCVKGAWIASRKDHAFYYNTLLFEDQTEKFRILAASVIEEEDIQTDLEDVLLKTPSDKDKLKAFVFEGRIE